MKETKNLKKLQGFTILELIIVIAILGVISAVVIPVSIVATRENTLQVDKTAASDMTSVLKEFALKKGIGKGIAQALGGYAIRTLLMENGYDLVAGSKNSVFVFNIEKEEAEIIAYNDLFDGVAYTPIDCTHVSDKYLLISMGNSRAERALNALLSITSNEDWLSFLSLADGLPVKEKWQTFSPENTLFLWGRKNSDGAMEYGAYTTALGTASKAVYSDGLRAVPNLESVRAHLAPDSLNKPYTVRTYLDETNDSMYFSEN